MIMIARRACYHDNSDDITNHVYMITVISRIIEYVQYVAYTPGASHLP